MSEEQEYEDVLCRLCGKWYKHPKDCTSGWGKCENCFWQDIDFFKSWMEHEENEDAKRNRTT